MPTSAAARAYPRGEIALVFCQKCGFIFNALFDPSLHEYSERYEETQGFSPTFNRFHLSLAERLIDRFDLHGKRIIEIGCGKGEFLTLLCRLGGNQGIGFDPSYVPGREGDRLGAQVSFVQDFYSEEYASCHADFICCKMTLEHIQEAAAFVGMVRRSIGPRRETAVFFQVPNVVRILTELAFWDIYYEHCSYFSPGSLASLFRRSGFEVMALAQGYDDQYIMIEARPVEQNSNHLSAGTFDMPELERCVSLFGRNIGQMVGRWKSALQKMTADGKRVVLWGGGSKAVAFLTTLGIEKEVEYVVDVNPHRHGTYIAGTGQEIVGPDALQRYKPDVVVVMNPVYREEIRRDLAGRGLAPDLLTVTDSTSAHA